MSNKFIFHFCIALVLPGLGGCLHGSAGRSSAPDVPVASAPVAPLAVAERLYAEGKTSEALLECVELTRRQPELPGLDALRQKIVRAELERRAAAIEAAKAGSADAVNQETETKSLLPDTYGLVKATQGGAPLLRTQPTAIQKAMQQPITMHLKEADLGAIIETIGRIRSINIVADKAVGQDRKMNVEMDNVPLVEVLDYIARNLGVEFYFGNNVVWVTAPATAGRVPLETRIYKLQHGLQYHASDWAELQDPKAVSKTVRPDGLPGLTGEATEQSSRATSLEETLKRFVPMVPGADYHFERDMHLLIVRHTRANLALIEDLIAALDAVPPQVLIEARFVTTRASDLRELGIDWIMNSSLGVGGKQDGRSFTQVGNGSKATFVPYGYDDKGTFPLGPQGSFGVNRSGNVNPATASQGLNLTYRGVLTEPLFTAVLHALDVSGKGRTLSVPRVTTVNNSPAKLRNGQDLLYFDEYQAQVFTSYDPTTKLSQSFAALFPKGKPVKEELGITLLAVPSVGADMSTINLMLMPTISQQEGWTDYQNDTTNKVTIHQVAIKLPLIVRREVQTKVIVQTGETVVMGGLIDSVKQSTVHKVPFLSDIPLLGKLFTRVDVTEENENLLIFVTASVVSERGETLVTRVPGQVPGGDTGKTP
jgi:type IV pilus assembly protein PilQ